MKQEVQIGVGRKPGIAESGLISSDQNLNVYPGGGHFFSERLPEQAEGGILLCFRVQPFDGDINPRVAITLDEEIEILTAGEKVRRR